MELTAQVSALTKNLEKMVRPVATVENQTILPLRNVKVQDKSEGRLRYDDCVQLGNKDCCH